MSEEYMTEKEISDNLRHAEIDQAISRMKYMVCQYISYFPNQAIIENGNIPPASIEQIRKEMKTGQFMITPSDKINITPDPRIDIEFVKQMLEILRQLQDEKYKLLGLKS